jgi:hypothetical protein
MEIWPANQSQTEFARIVLLLALVVVPSLFLPGDAGRWVAFGVALLMFAFLVFDWWVRPNLFPETTLTDQEKLAAAFQAWITRQGMVDEDRLKKLEVVNQSLLTRLGNMDADLAAAKGELAALRAAKEAPPS